jgi:allantoinase
LPALLSEGVHRRGLSLPALARMTAANPARIFGLFPRKGALLPGADADLVVVDPQRTWTLTADQLLYKNPHSAYLGCTFHGAVERTFVRGTMVYAQGQVQVQPGFGELLRRQEPGSAPQGT